MKELIASNKYGKLYRTSKGYHINGNKSKFLENIKKLSYDKIQSKS